MVAMAHDKDKQEDNSSGKDRFGSISIRPLAGEGAKAGPTAPDSPPGRQAAPDSSEPPPGVRRRKGRAAGPRRVKPNRLVLFSLLLSGLAACLWIGSILLVPSAIKGPLVSYLSGQLGSRLEVVKVRFSPFSLQLHLESIRLLPLSGSAEASLPVADRISCRLSPGQLLDGAIGIVNLRVENPQLELIRTRDNNLKLVGLGSIGLDQPLDALQIPGWLAIQQLEIINGRIVCTDQKTGNRFQARELHLTLPWSQYNELVPSFRGIINGIAVELESVTSRVEQGRGQYLIQLQTGDTDLAELALPILSGKASVQGRSTCSLDLILPETNTTLQQVRLAAHCSVSDLQLTEIEHQQQVLQVPSARFVLSAHPGQGEYTLREVVLKKPKVQFSRTGQNQGWAPLAGSLQDLSDSKLRLAIERLQLDRGEIRMPLPADDPKASVSWQELHLSLTDFHNAAYDRRHRLQGQQAAVVVNAVEGSSGGERATLSFQGQLQPPFTLNGSLSLSNVRAEQTMMVVRPADRPLFSKGRLDFTGAVSWKPMAAKQKLFVDTATLTARAYELQLKDGAVLTGAHLVCRGLAGTREEVECAHLDLTGTTLPALPISALQDWAGTLPLVLHELNVTGGQVRIPADGTQAADGAGLDLREISMHYGGQKDSAQGRRTLSLAAKTGQYGEIRVNGRLDAEAKGTLEVTGQGLEASILQPIFLPWLPKRIYRGRVRFDGRYTVPAAEFSGSVRLDAGAMGSPEATGLAWGALLASGVAYSPSPRRLSIDEIELVKPDFQPAGGVAEAAVSLLPISPGKEQPQNGMSELVIGRVKVQQGSFVSSEEMVARGYRPSCQDIEGKAENISLQGRYTFALKGKCGDGRFRLQGSGEGDSLADYRLEFDNFALAGNADTFAEMMQVDARGAAAAWRLAYENDRADLAAEVALSGLSPLAGSPYAALLALITDPSDSLQVRLDGAGKRSSMMLERVIRQLQQMKIKADIDPGLVLPEAFEHVPLPYRVTFEQGEADTEPAVELEQLAALLAERPHMQLVVQGSYDVLDGVHLQQLLQEEEDSKRAYENLKREQLREEYLEQDRQRQGLDGSGEVVNWFDLPEEVLPAPHRKVVVANETLEDLARQRAAALALRLKEFLGAEASPRVAVSNEPLSSGAWAEVRLLPEWAIEER